MGEERVERGRAASRNGDAGWSFLLLRVTGIPVRVHFTFALLLVWVGFFSWRAGGRAMVSVALLLTLFGCVVLHELGHALAARAFGVKTREIVLYPIGGIARLERMPRGLAELVIAAAGPLVNLGLAGVLLASMVLLEAAPASLERMLTEPTFLDSILLANVILFGFNLIPAFPMDGGRILRAALALRLSDERATSIAATVGQGIAILFGLWGLTPYGSPLLLFIAFFVFLGAGQEAHFHRQRSAVIGRCAREAMMTRFEVLAPQDSLGRAGEHLVATSQQDFPVIDAWNRVAGVLSRAALLEGLARLGNEGPVLDVMQRTVPTVGPEGDLEEVLRQLRANPSLPVLVLDDDVLLGMITLDNLTEFIEITRRSS